MPIEIHRGYQIDVRPAGYGGSLVCIARDQLLRVAMEAETEDRGFVVGRLMVDLLASGEFRVPGDAFSSMGCHFFPDPSILPLPVLQEWTSTGPCDHTVASDQDGRVSSNLVAGTFLVFDDVEGGFYYHDYHASWQVSGGQDKDTITNAMVIFASPIPIASATNASPSVLTIVGHPLRNGSTVIISGETGNTAINGSRVIANVAVDTFELTGLDGNAVNGSGASNGDGLITHAGRAGTVVRTSVRDGSPVNIRGAVGGNLSEGDRVGVFYAILNSPPRAPEIFAMAHSLIREGSQLDG